MAWSPEDTNRPVSSLLPHGEQFRFVDRVREFSPGKSIVAELNLRPEAPYFAGHFPDRPLMPGVLMTEALAQASGLLLGLTHESANPAKEGPLPRFYLAASQMKFTRPVPPGVTLILHSELERDFGELVRCQVRATLEAEVVAAGAVTLAAIAEES